MFRTGINRFLNFLKLVILLDLATSAIVGLICWAQWRSLEHFANGILIAGAIIIAIGVLSSVGSAGRYGLFDSQYKYAASSEESFRIGQLNSHLLDSSHNLALFMSVAGGLLVILSFFIS